MLDSREKERGDDEVTKADKECEKISTYLGNLSRFDK
jgi:hypothetical protein